MPLPYELDGHAHDDAERVQDNKRHATNYCPLCEHYARSAEKLNDETRALRQRVEELEGTPRCCADTIPPGCRTCRCTDAAEARLAKVVKAADALLSYLQQLELLTYEPADWENPTVVEFKAALAAAKGE